MRKQLTLLPPPAPNGAGGRAEIGWDAFRGTQDNERLQGDALVVAVVELFEGTREGALEKVGLSICHIRPVS